MTTRQRTVFAMRRANGKPDARRARREIRRLDLDGRATTAQRLGTAAALPSSAARVASARPTKPLIERVVARGDRRQARGVRGRDFITVRRSGTAQRSGLLDTRTTNRFERGLCPRNPALRRYYGHTISRVSRTGPALPGRSERWGVWGAISGPPNQSNIEVQRELPRVRTQPDRIDLVLPLVLEPGLDDVRREHVTL